MVVCGFSRPAEVRRDAGALPSTGVALAEFLVFTLGTRRRLFSLFMFSRTHGTLEVKLREISLPRVLMKWPFMLTEIFSIEYLS